MKKSLLLLLFILFSVSCSQITPQPESVENQRSLASEDCNDIVGQFFVKQNPTLELNKQSIFALNPMIHEKMNSLRLESIDYNTFYQDFMTKNHKAPTLRDLLNYAYQIKAATLNNYENIISELLKLPTAESEAIQNFILTLRASKNKLGNVRSIEQIELELEASFEKGKSVIPDLDTVVTLEKNTNKISPEFLQFLKDRTSLNNFQGEYGELIAYGASGDKVIARGLTFDKEVTLARTPTEALVAKRLIELQDRIKLMSNEQLLTFIEPHKEGLFRVAYNALAEEKFSWSKRDLIVEKMINMIKSKEIDLVEQDLDGKMIWGEVKAYNRPIKIGTIDGPGKGKTILDQLKEHKALRDVLGLESDVKLRFISPLSIVSEDARKLIESIGYEVISAK